MAAKIIFIALNSFVHLLACSKVGALSPGISEYSEIFEVYTAIAVEVLGQINSAIRRVILPKIILALWIRQSALPINRNKNWKCRVKGVYSG